ncbi:hypothetical protein GHT06_022524 [Daphnia sinensis]|uniref:Uncharacterized protein n=1 Tax=Daphnia sinensis TaxID=1820382 RepID=A0AAD5KII2_9CRUS|nr:hypothetical protein GHT06_022524 [Daphnia sinensis]
MGQRNRYNKSTRQTENETLQTKKKRMKGNKKWENGKKLYNKTVQNEVDNEKGRKKQRRKSDNETVQNRRRRRGRIGQRKEKLKEEGRHTSTEAADANETAAAEAESYHTTLKGNRSFANRTGAVTR